MKNEIVASNEILGAMLSAEVEDTEALTDNPKAYIQSKAGFEIIGSVDLNIITNDANTVALALPYYKHLAEVAPDVISDDEIGQATGGFIGGFASFQQLYGHGARVRRRRAQEERDNNGK